MILLREAEARDIDALARLAQVPGFLSLPREREELAALIERSAQSFADARDPVTAPPRLTNKFEAKYVFIAEEAGAVLGTAMIGAQHGTVESPHFYFEIEQEEKFSKTINTGFIHGTLKLRYDTNGPTEIGGLVIDPDHRNSRSRAGRQISFVRFLFMGLHKNRFKRRVIAELLPPLDPSGRSPLWEAIGRRFTNMDYWEADRLCARNKEFVLSLFPAGKIYTTFLSAEARDAIGKVGRATEPVWHMLTKIGFVYRQQVDPFDGGPHLWANVDEIRPIQKIKSGTLAVTPEASPAGHSGDPSFEEGLLAADHHARGGDERAARFRAVHVMARTHAGRIELASPEQLAEAQSALSVVAGDGVVFMPYY